jgi:hypothetical protein
MIRHGAAHSDAFVSCLHSRPTSARQDKDPLFAVRMFVADLVVALAAWLQLHDSELCTARSTYGLKLGVNRCRISGFHLIAT